MNTQNQLTTQNSGISISSIEDLERAARLVAKSGLAPNALKTPEAIAVAMATGIELGLAPMASLNSIAVINGRPSLYGDAQLALVRQSGLLEAFKETVVGEGEEKGFECMVKRRGMDASTQTFTVANAKRAGLWGKSGPWTQFPDRMLRLRARSFALRDGFGDVLMGMISVEEMRDVPAEREVTGTVVEEESAWKVIDPFAVEDNGAEPELQMPVEPATVTINQEDLI